MADADRSPPEPRDDAIARALAVEPLDELMRHRLVRTALDGAVESASNGGAETPRRGRIRALAVAAAAVAFVALGVTALTLPGDDGTDLADRSPSARDRSAATPETAPSGPLSADSGGADEFSPSSPAPAAQAHGSRAASLPDLGDLGELGTAGSEPRVRAAAEPLVAGLAAQRWSFAFEHCAALTVDAVASGLGSVDGVPVQVVVTRRADGTLRVRAIDGGTCELRSLP